MKKKELTLLDLLKFIWNRRYIALFGSVIIMIVLFIGIRILYNPGRQFYTATFEYSFPRIETGQYPSGEKFEYRDIVEYDRLLLVKNSDEKYEKINIEQMYNRSNIEILTVFSEVTGSRVLVPNTYTIIVSQRYFKSYALAKSFISDLINYPYIKALNNIENLVYDENLKASVNSKQYDNQIQYLINQKQLLIDGYNSLISIYGDRYVDGKKLIEYQLEVEIFFQNNNIELLTVELEDNDYVKNYEDYESQLLLQVSRLKKEKEDNQKLRDYLKREIEELVAIYGSAASSVISYEEYNRVIAASIERDVQIERELKVVNDKLDSQGTVTEQQLKFKDKINNYYESLTNMTEEYREVITTLYKERTKIHYEKSAIITAEGGIGLVLNAAISLLVGFIITSAIIIMIETPKFNKKEEETSQQ